METATDALLTRLQQAIDHFEAKVSRAKRLTYALRISIMILGALSTILLGLSVERAGYLTFSRNAALIISAVMTLLGSLASFWNVESYWLSNRLKLAQLKALKEEHVLLGVRQAQRGKEEESILERYLVVVDSSPLWEDAWQRHRSEGGNQAESKRAV